MMRKEEEENKTRTGQDKNSNLAVQIDYTKYQPFLEEVKSKNLNSIDYICASIKYGVSPQDSTFYNQKNSHFVPTKYPQTPLPIRAETLEKFNEDTLFFIFFVQQDVYLRYAVGKELNKRGWMYNKKFQTFFQLQGAPKNKTDEFIEGRFRFFDFEENWQLRFKKDYKFEFQMLEKMD